MRLFLNKAKSEIQSQVKPTSVVFKSNYLKQCKKCMYNLCKAIKDAKKVFWTKLRIATGRSVDCGKAGML